MTVQDQENDEKNVWIYMTKDGVDSEIVPEDLNIMASEEVYNNIKSCVISETVLKE